MSLEYYEFGILDCAHHVVAGITLLAEIVRSFDRPDAEPKFYESLDEAAYSAAKGIFCNLPDIRLFQGMEVEMQARLS